MHPWLSRVLISSRPALCCIAAVGFMGCTSDLWNRYIRDTDDSCVRVGCAAGQTCNSDTGLCEAGAPVDMGPIDMDNRDAASPTAFFDLPMSIITSSAIDTNIYYQVATGHPTASLTQRDWLLIGDKSEYTRLHPQGGLQSTYSVSTVATVALPSYLAQYPRNVAGNLDLLLPLTTTKIARVSPTLPGTMDATTGFKLLSVGDINNDGLADFLVPSSLLPIGAVVYPGATSDGTVQVFIGQPDYTAKPATLIGTPPANVISATAQLGTQKTEFNLALVTKKKPEVASLIMGDGDAGGYKLNLVFDATIPTSDIAVPVDIDGDGDNDLVLVQLYDGDPAFKGVLGAVYVAYNAGLGDPESFRNGHLFQLDTGLAAVLNVKVDDFDKDGFPDVAIMLGTGSGGNVVLFHNEAVKDPLISRLPRPVLRLRGNPPARSVEFVDLDNDGCKDLLMLFSGEILGQSGSHTSLLVARGKKSGVVDCP